MVERPTAPPELLAYLEAHAVPHNVVTPSVPLLNVKKAAKVIGTEPAAIVKSLIWRAADGSLALVIASALAKIDPHKLAAATGKAGWARAPATVAHEATGYAAGVAPPVGSGYGERFPVLIDRMVMAQPVIFAGGGREAVLLCLLPRDIQRLTGATVHDLIA